MKHALNYSSMILLCVFSQIIIAADEPVTVGDDNRNRTLIRQHLGDQLKNRSELTDDDLFRLPDHTTFTVHGWTIHLSDRLWQDKDGVANTQAMLRLLAGQLDRVVKAVPKEAVAKLRTVPVWINPKYEGVKPRCEYHPAAGWLRQNGRDSEMARAIEITNVSIFAFENRRMPYLMLHELAHAYHDQVLGFDEPHIVATFELARDSGGYEKVKRFTGKKMVTDKAYALSNHKEYFAETTEAYFGRNDFYPFSRTELRSHDRPMHDLLARLWGVK